MKPRLAALIVALGMLAVSGCGTIAGTAIGAGIGSVSGDTKAGAMIGGGVGMLYDFF